MKNYSGFNEAKRTFAERKFFCLHFCLRKYKFRSKMVRMVKKLYKTSPPTNIICILISIIDTFSPRYAWLVTELKRKITFSQYRLYHHSSILENFKCSQTPSTSHFRLYHNQQTQRQCLIVFNLDVNTFFRPKKSP